MTWFAVGAAAIGAIGSIAGGGNSSSQTSQSTLDPRVGNLLYGGAGGGGLLNSVNNTATQQMAQGGLNNIQTAGLNSQLGVLTDPNYTTGFNQMRGLGSSMLGQPVAGNPFTGGNAAQSPFQSNYPAPYQAPGGSAPGRMTAMPVGGFQGSGQMPMVGGGAINANTVRGPMTGLLGGLQVTNTQAPQAPMTQNDLLALLRQQQQNQAPAQGGLPQQDPNGGGGFTAGQGG